jgi:N6-adenosine-specific RNA methylase IME4
MSRLPRVRGGFRCILADPPWSFADRGTRLAPSYEGRQRKSAAPYSVMGLREIVALDVIYIAAPSAFLFLWAPGSFVIGGQATEVARAWGFEPKQILPWIKTTKDGRPRIGGGHYTRLTAEYLLLCRRGDAKVKTHAEPDVLFAPRARHSEKPDESYRKIERLCAGPRLELFARRRVEGWDAWGNEAPEEREASNG